MSVTENNLEKNRWTWSALIDWNIHRTVDILSGHGKKVFRET